MKKQLGRCGVTWRFIPKRAPGKGILGTPGRFDQVSNQEGFREAPHILETIITEIEAVINDRPLAFVSSELCDVEPLTPAHLLHGRRMITYLPHKMVDTDEAIDPFYGILLQLTGEQRCWHQSCKIFRRGGDMTTLRHLENSIEHQVPLINTISIIELKVSTYNVQNKHSKQPR